MSNVADQRRDSRLPFDVEVEIRTPENVLRAKINDISLSGLFVHCAEFLPLDTLCEVEVLGASGEASLKNEAQVVRQVQDPATGIQGMGLKFLGLDGD